MHKNDLRNIWMVANFWCGNDSYVSNEGARNWYASTNSSHSSYVVIIVHIPYAPFVVAGSGVIHDRDLGAPGQLLERASCSSGYSGP
jgi:hypothetical protein